MAQRTGRELPSRSAAAHGMYPSLKAVKCFITPKTNVIESFIPLLHATTFCRKCPWIIVAIVRHGNGDATRGVTDSHLAHHLLTPKGFTPAKRSWYMAKISNSNHPTPPLSVQCLTVPNVSNKKPSNSVAVRGLEQCFPISKWGCLEEIT